MIVARVAPVLPRLLAHASLLQALVVATAFAEPARDSHPAEPRAADPVTRTIERRPPARPLADAARVDERKLTAADLDRLAREARARWMESGHGSMLVRILPERLTPAQLPQADSRGARLTALYCVQCHHLPDPAMHDARRWPGIVQRMVPRMEGRGNLGPLMSDLMRGPDAQTRPLAAPTRDEERQIIAYLQRNAQHGFDAAAQPALAGALDDDAGRMFSRACSQCHVLPDPKRHTAEEWPEVVQRMQHNMLWMNRVEAGNADPREPKLFAGDIVRFLQRHARR